MTFIHLEDYMFHDIRANIISSMNLSCSLINLFCSQTRENDRLTLKSHLIQSYDLNSIIKVARQKMKCFLCLLLYI